MSDEYFNAKNTGFWGALAAFFWSLPKILEYIKAKKNQKINDELAKALTKETDMSEEKKGIKETKECILAAKAVSILIIKKVKDGIQIQDGMDIAGALLLDPDLKNAISAAIDKANEVPGEMSDLDLLESLELAKIGIDSVPEYIEALKKS